MDKFGRDPLDSVVIAPNLEELGLEGDDLSPGITQFRLGGDSSISCAEYIESELLVGLF